MVVFRDTDLREIFRLVGEAFFKDWTVAEIHSSPKLEASCSWHNKYVFSREK
jgi:hypothetical protein